MSRAVGGVPRETVKRLDVFWSQLLRWDRAVGLIAPTTSEAGWRRHIEDSIQLVDHFPPRSVKHCDLGSGGGVPAIPVAILRQDVGFGDELIMIEADARKATFLRTIIRELGLRAAVFNSRLEHASPCEADVVTARALAPLDRLLGYVSRHVGPSGHAVLPKGRRAEEEIACARRRWMFDVVAHPSRTAPDASVLVVSNIRRLEVRNGA